MDALPLPLRPNLDQYKKRAKELVDAARAGKADAIRAWASAWLTALTQALDMTQAPNYASLLKQATHRQRIAEALADAVLRYRASLKSAPSTGPKTAARTEPR